MLYFMQLILVAVDGYDWRFTRQYAAVRQAEIAHRAGQNDQIGFFQGVSSVLSCLAIEFRVNWKNGITNCFINL